MRLWSLLLALALVASGTAITPRSIWADEYPGEPAPSPAPDTGTGDPDWPDSPSAKSPKPSPVRGVGGPGPREQVQVTWSGKWVWGFRMAFASVYRIFFRF
jgi:hypothetical protein